jgi:hypothetical protein
MTPGFHGIAFLLRFRAFLTASKRSLGVLAKEKRPKATDIACPMKAEYTVHKKGKAPFKTKLQ